MQASLVTSVNWSSNQFVITIIPTLAREENKMKSSRRKSIAVRSKNGSSLLELPCTLLVFFVMLLLPMLNLATTSLRCSLMGMAAQEGAHAAAKARTYESGTTEKPAAISVASAVVNEAASRFSGLIVENVSTNIIITDSTSGSVSKQSARLITPPDSSRFIYQIETNVRARVEPLFVVNNSLFGDIPGLTSAIPMSYSTREMFENPSGLTQ